MISAITLSTFSFRFVLYYLLWWFITEASPGSWYLGIPVVILATWVSLLLAPKISVSVLEILRFIPFFLWHSFRGGIDVALRVLKPQLAIDPGVVKYRWHLPPGLAQTLMTNIVSLLPGTLSAKLDDTHLHLHVLDMSEDIFSELNIIEKRVASMLALKLSSTNS